MKVKSYLLLCLLAMLAIAACKKSSTTKPGTTKIDTDVYVVGGINVLASGNYYHVAVYWKNGVLTKLTDTTQNWYATGIVVKNGKVYVSGYQQIAQGSINMAAYWVNGVKKDLSPPAGNTIATGVGINNDGAYVVGTMYDGVENHAEYWKDGGSTQTLDLPAGATGSTANGVYGIGNDFYVAGSVDNNGNDYYGAYWKNHTPIKSESLRSYVNAIASDGTHVYMAGSTHDFIFGTGGNPSIYTDTAIYWKDTDKATNLTGGSQHVVYNHYTEDAEAVAIDGSSNVYMAGYTSDANKNHVATWWKNETPIKTTTITDGSELKGIAVLGTDVFVAGLTSTAISARGAYWKNSIRKSLDRAVKIDEITGIAVDVHPH